MRLMNWFSNPSPSGLYYTYDIDDMYNDEEYLNKDSFFLL